MERRVYATRPVRLEHKPHEVQQSCNRSRPETVADGFHGLVLKFPARHGFGIGAFHHIDRLRTLLKRSHDLRQMALLVMQVGTDDVLAGWTYGHAIGRFVIGAMAETLPHGHRLGLINTPAIIDSVARICDLLDPIGKPSQKLAIIVAEAGREIE